MLDQILSPGSQGQPKPDQNSDHAQFRRPASPDGTPQSPRAASGDAQFRRPGSEDLAEKAPQPACTVTPGPVPPSEGPTPLLSVLPTAFSVTGTPASAPSQSPVSSAGFARESGDAAFGKPASRASVQAVVRSAVPGRPAALLSVLPSAISAAEPEKPAAEGSGEGQTGDPSESSERKDAANKKAHGDKETGLFGLRWTPARIVCVVAAILAVVLCLDQILMPSLRYRKALRLEKEGSYALAIEQYEALGSYRDSTKRIRLLQEETARMLMQDGRYQEALNYLDSTGKTSSLTGDCIYALGVTAYNDGDLETALEYVAKLRERFPNYKDLKQLEQYCYYSLGGRKAAEAAAISQPSLAASRYEEAIDAFARAGSYTDTADRILACRYQLALVCASGDALEQAIDILTDLNGYRDSAELRLNLMYEYVTTVQSFSDGMDPNVPYYLNELVAADYPGAAVLQDRFNGIGFSFGLEYGDAHAPIPDEVTDYSQVYIRYEINAKDSGDPNLVQLVCVLPDGDEIWTTLNDDGSSSGVIRLYRLFNGAIFCTKSGPTILVFKDLNSGVTIGTLSFDYVVPPVEGGSPS